MKQLDIRFVKEHNAKKAEYQLSTIAKLQERLPKRLGEKYSDVSIRIRLSSQSGFELKGFNGAEKQKFTELLEEIWEDPTLLE